MAMVYVHIPYCRTHCTYCAFYSELLPKGRGPESFVDALCREMEYEYAVQSNPVLEHPPGFNTLYFGGGTPSLLYPEHIERIRDCIPVDHFDEFTLEVNPDDIVDKSIFYFEALRKIGVNRISMGIQSFDDGVLHRMGRRHNASEAIEAYKMLRAAGFDNISVDFIFGFSEKWSVDSIMDGLSLLGSLPDHISCYQLSVEEGSGLEKMLDRGLFNMPSDEICAAQYASLCRALRHLGYEHYEISNWALQGRHSRHNSAYWNHTPYIGFGPGAHSLIQAPDGKWVRRWNNPSLYEYVGAMKYAHGAEDLRKVRGQETLSGEQYLEEELMLGLRTAHGVPESLFQSLEVNAAFPESLVKTGDGHLRIPEEKWFVSDSIIAEIVSIFV